MSPFPDMAMNSVCGGITTVAPPEKVNDRDGNVDNCDGESRE